jgi:hypothetical protein
MVTRRSCLTFLGGLVACSEPSPPPPLESLVLQGFRLVDVQARRVREDPLVIEGGVVVSKPTSERPRVIEGHGAFLLPALWDLKASLWGNNSALSYDVLTQEATLSRCLRLQLHYGVAHVGVFGMARRWAGRELRRAEVFGLTAAEPLYPDKVLCAKEGFACDAVTDAASARRVLEDRRQHGAPLLYVSFHDARHPDLPGVPESVRNELAPAATRLRIFALVEDWSEARRAVELGARVIYGFPPGPAPDSLLALMKERGAALAPALTRYLELDRLLGNDVALTDAFVRASVRPDVLETYRDERRLWSEWRAELQHGRAHGRTMLSSVERAARAGVKVVVASDAGWTAGCFQGIASHGAQLWLERAGLDGWARLAAATTTPADVLGRSVGFLPGQAADYVGLEKNPVERADNLRHISLVLRRGRVVARPELLPDLTRGSYVP